MEVLIDDNLLFTEQVLRTESLGYQFATLFILLKNIASHKQKNKNK